MVLSTAAPGTHARTQGPALREQRVGGAVRVEGAHRDDRQAVRGCRDRAATSRPGRERGREAGPARGVVAGGADDQGAVAGQFLEDRVERRIEQLVLGGLVVVPHRQAQHVDRVAARLPGAVAAGELGDLAQRRHPVRLDDRAGRGHHPPGQDVGVRARLVHQARDEGAVPGERVDDAVELAGQVAVQLGVADGLGVPDRVAVQGDVLAHDGVEPGVCAAAGVEDGHDRAPAGPAPRWRSAAAAGRRTRRAGAPRCPGRRTCSPVTRRRPLRPARSGGSSRRGATVERVGPVERPGEARCGRARPPAAARRRTGRGPAAAASTRPEPSSPGASRRTAPRGGRRSAGRRCAGRPPPDRRPSRARRRRCAARRASRRSRRSSRWSAGDRRTRSSAGAPP